jgi:hypothetical protein
METQVFYEIFLSPLRHIPGPRINKISSLGLRLSEMQAKRAPVSTAQPELVKLMQRCAFG